MSIAVLFAVVSFFLTIGGGRLSETGMTAGERMSGLFCVVVGAIFAIGAIFAAVMAIAPNFWS